METQVYILKMNGAYFMIVKEELIYECWNR